MRPRSPRRGWDKPVRMRRVAVSGIGIVSPLGCTTAEIWERARAGQSAVRRLDAPFASRLVAPLAATAVFDGAVHFEPPKLRMLDRVSQFALVCAGRALADSGGALEGLDLGRAGVFV